MLLTIPPAKYVTFQKDYKDFRVAAIEAHGTQMYGAMPYAYHLAMVENVLIEHSFTEFDLVAAGWLHDVIEDTEVKYEDIIVHYNWIIADLVWACTGEGKNRKEKANSIYKKLKANPSGAIIKVADRITNIMTGLEENNERKLRMYLKEWPEFKANVQPLMLGTTDRRRTYMWSELEDYIERAKKCLRHKP